MKRPAHGRTVTRRGFLKAAAAGALAASAARAGPADQRKRRFSATDRKQALAWQAASRKLLLELMALGDLVEADRPARGRPGIALKPAVTSTKVEEDYTLYELGLSSTPARRIGAILTVPKGANRRKCPAVVCIHGHGGNRRTPYAPSGAYRGFGLALAKRGFVTISTDVGQHEVYEKGRTLMGERLWDVMRCVTCLTTRPEVDAKRIGCAGLSLGGEMAMWLGAMDTRLAATVSSGFLTTVANMRRGHCPCWEFPHLTENFDFADVYSLIAPRPLCCQNGRKERAGGGFPVAIAEKAMSQVKACYAVFGRSDSARLVVHDEGHVIDLPSCLAFLDQHLGRKEDRQARQIGTRRSALGPGRLRGARIHPAARSA